jgi:acyl-coenzyme A thioesterase PaaI-like protein
MKKCLLLRAINAWPPFLGAGIRVTRMGSKAVDVEMKLRRWNRNYVGTHFGGSLYSMTDPFFMLMLLDNLGPEYLVWDKAATIRFKKPGRGKVRAEFRLSDEQIDEIRRAATNGKTEPTFVVQVKDEAGEVVAEVEKVLWVKRKASTPNRDSSRALGREGRSRGSE